MAVHERDLLQRAFELSVRVCRLYNQLAKAGPAIAFVARELMRATTSIGANLEEGAAPSSRRDMASKHSISLREAREANYWARIGAADPRWTADFNPIVDETREFVAMLTTSVKKLRLPSSDPNAQRPADS